jgi:Uma2 family endonuclease
MARNLREDEVQRYTLEEYFALEKASERRYEYWDGEILCMSGGTLAHGQISGNTYSAIRSKLEGTNCQTFTADMAIKTPTLGPYRYPDVSVVCGQVQVERIQGIDVIVNPALIVEVLSPNTEDRDRREKRTAYQDISSVREYLLVSQEIPHITHYVREGDAWRRADYSMGAEQIECPSIGIALRVDEMYQGVRFE